MGCRGWLGHCVLVALAVFAFSGLGRAELASADKVRTAFVVHKAHSLIRNRGPLERPVQLPTLTSASAVHGLTPAQARRHYPVHLQAVCVVCFPDWWGFFANDWAAGVYVQTKNHVPLTASMHPGTWFEVDGVTDAGEYAPIIDQGSLKILGEKPVPQARLVSLDQISTGAEDGQWIEFEGTVRSATLRDSMVSMIVASGRLQIEVMTPPDGRDFCPLIHARVRIRGTVGPIFNQRHQLVAVNVYAPSLKTVQVLQPAPKDIFSLPLKPVSGVFEYSPGAGSDHLVRIRGVVTARWGKTVFISDGVQGASVQSNEMSSLQPGETVDAVGYPVLDDQEHTISEAEFRQLGSAPLPEPKSISAKEALSGDYESDLVRMDGRLIELQKAADQYNLLIDSGGTVFSAVLPGELKEKTFADLHDGSQIQVTGICVITGTQASRHFRLPKAFQILLRTPADVVLVRNPSWWTPAHALFLLALALTGTVVVLAWVVALRRRVAQQTTLLRQQADLLRESEQRFRHMAQHDTLTGLATRLVLQDRLNQALETGKRNNTGLALLMVDIDKFKVINDTIGHHAGDQVLLVTASRLVETVRKADTVARMGGDEFVVLLNELAEPQYAEIIAEKIVATLSLPILIEGRDVSISVSVGVCTAAVAGLESDALQRGADQAMYRAKELGRNCFQVFTEDLLRN